MKPAGALSFRLLRRALVRAGQATAGQRVSLVAAGCAFYATLALFPAITMMISLYGLIYNPETVQPQLLYIQGFMPPAAYTLISDRIKEVVAEPAQGLGVSFLFSLAISLWSSSSGTKSVLNALTLAYEAEETRGILMFQLVSLGATLMGILGAIMAVGVLVAIPICIAQLGISVHAKYLAGLAGTTAMIVFISSSLVLLYRFGPSCSGRIFTLPGAALATIVWLAGSSAFGLYVGHFAAYSITYGPLATLIGLMMWFYLTAYAVLFGAEVNAALDKEWRRAHPASAPAEPLMVTPAV